MKKKKLKYWFFGFFLFGILLANLLGRERLKGFGIFNTYFLQQFEYAKIDEIDLFLYLCRERLLVLGVLMLIGITEYCLAAHLVFLSWSGGAIGFLLVSALSNLGPKGIIMVAVSLLPQYLFYVSAYCLLLEIQLMLQENRRAIPASGKMRKRGALLATGGLTFLLVLFGILTETYVNPNLMKNILKFF